MTVLALKCLGLAWVVVILAVCAWIGLQVLQSAIAERRGRRVHHGRQDVARVDALAEQWSRP